MHWLFSKAYCSISKKNVKFFDRIDYPYSIDATKGALIVW